jgi:two-component system, chemotaxis family, sensor kinase Cph1
VTVGVSAGVVAGGGDVAPAEVVASADAAMYRAKKAGGARLSA